MNEVMPIMGKITRMGLTLRVYVFEVDGLLIDTGPRSIFNQFKPIFKTLPIEQIALTHVHEDHSGNAHWWSKRNIPIYINEKSLAYTGENGKHPLYRRIYWGPRKPFNAKPIPNELKTENYRFQVINTPGHSDDHISLYEESQGWLFTGDLYITQKPKLFLKEESIPKTIESLKRLTELDFEYLYCSHTGKIKDGKQKLQGKLDYLLELQDNVLNLHKEGLTNNQIASKLFPKNSPVVFFSRNEFSYIRGIESIVNND